MEFHPIRTCGAVWETDPVGRTTSYEYDDANRVTLVTLPNSIAADPTTAPTTEFTYYATGDVHTKTEWLDWLNVAVTLYGYDAHDRLNFIQKPNGETNQFVYDAVGNLSEVYDGN